MYVGRLAEALSGGDVPAPSPAYHATRHISPGHPNAKRLIAARRHSVTGGSGIAQTVT
jgi:hypothetical protein